MLSQAHRVLRPGGRIAFTVWAPADQLEAFGVAFAAVAQFVEPEQQSTTQPPAIGTEPAENYETLLTQTGFSRPTARTVDLSWPLTDGAAIFDGFDRFLNLTDQTPDIRAQIRRRLDDLVRDNAGPDGVARLRNPAIIAAATKP